MEKASKRSSTSSAADLPSASTASSESSASPLRSESASPSARYLALSTSLGTEFSCVGVATEPRLTGVALAVECRRFVLPSATRIACLVPLLEHCS